MLYTFFLLADEQLYYISLPLEEKRRLYSCGNRIVPLPGDEAICESSFCYTRQDTHLG